MKAIITACILMTLLISCKENPKEMDTKVSDSEMITSMEKPSYPEALAKVFEAHGGLENWRNNRTLIYDIPKPDNRETHTTDLYERKDKIEGNGFTMGYDGEQVWLLDGEGTYKGDPIFYHNLMFYFYAMPFVLADDGVVYSETEDLEFEGKSYPGIGIGYNEGVGTSPKDEYFIHFDPETNQMAWLGYTVTYRSGEKSDNVKWIRYNDWMDVDDLILPKSLTWHAYEGRTIKEARSPLPFENVRLETESKPADFYTKPANAVFVKKKEEE